MTLSAPFDATTPPRERCAGRGASAGRGLPCWGLTVDTCDGTSDEALVEAMGRGDLQALAAFYDRHAGALLGAARLILRDACESEDLVHDVLLEAFSRARDFDPWRASARAWVLLRLRSRALDRRRSAARMAPSEAQPDDGVGIGLQEPPADARLDLARVRGAVSRLSSDQRQVLELGYFEELSSAEIAARLGLPLGTVKSRVAAGLTALRVALADPTLPAACAGARRPA